MRSVDISVVRCRNASVGRAPDGACTVGEDFAFGESAEGFGVSFALFGKHQCPQFCRSALVRYRHGTLQDHCAMIVLVISKMYRAATEFDPASDCGFVHMMPIHPVTTKGGYQ